MEDKSIYLLFFLAISIHNIEEALWLPSWSKYAKRFVKQVNPQEFRFAVLAVTMFALLATSAFIVFPEIETTRYIYFGFLGAMMINVICPHLVTTIVLRRYAPGLISGLFLNLPVNGIILYRALDGNTISPFEAVVSTLIIGAILLICLPLLFKLGRIVKEYKPD